MTYQFAQMLFAQCSLLVIGMLNRMLNLFAFWSSTVLYLILVHEAWWVELKAKHQQKPWEICLGLVSITGNCRCRWKFLSVPSLNQKQNFLHIRDRVVWAPAGLIHHLLLWTGSQFFFKHFEPVHWVIFWSFKQYGAIGNVSWIHIWRQPDRTPTPPPTHTQTCCHCTLLNSQLYK